LLKGYAGNNRNKSFNNGGQPLDLIPKNNLARKEINRKYGVGVLQKFQRENIKIMVTIEYGYRAKKEVN
jgi:hypothetical protein